MNLNRLTHHFARLAEYALNTEVDADPQAPGYNSAEDYSILIEEEGEPTYVLRLLVVPVQWQALGTSGQTVVKRMLKASAALTKATEDELANRGPLESNAPM